MQSHAIPCNPMQYMMVSTDIWLYISLLWNIGISWSVISQLYQSVVSIDCPCAHVPSLPSFPSCASCPPSPIVPRQTPFASFASFATFAYFVRPYFVRLLLCSPPTLFFDPPTSRSDKTQQRPTMPRATTCISHSLIMPIIIIGNKPTTWWCLFHIKLWSVPNCPPFPTPITSPRCPSRIPLYRALIQMHKHTNTGSEISGMVCEFRGGTLTPQNLGYL